MGIEPLDRAEQAEIAFFDQILKTEPFAGVAARDVDDEPEVGANHLIPGRGVAVFDSVCELLLLVGGKQGRLIDLAEIGLQGRLDGLASEPARSSHGEVPCGGRTESVTAVRIPANPSAGDRTGVCGR
jgi:hypothetical protein